jgi:hypothetical protein
MVHSCLRHDYVYIVVYSKATPTLKRGWYLLLTFAYHGYNEVSITDTLRYIPIGTQRLTFTARLGLEEASSSAP